MTDVCRAKGLHTLEAKWICLSRTPVSTLEDAFDEAKPGDVRSHRIDMREATSDETPVTITTTRARLEPVPPDGLEVTIVKPHAPLCYVCG